MSLILSSYLDIKNDSPAPKELCNVTNYIPLRPLRLFRFYLFIITTLVFLILISIPCALYVSFSLSIILCIVFQYVSFSLSIILCIVFRLSATNSVSSAYLRFVILIPLNLIPSILSMTSFIINSLCRLKS